MKQRHAKRIRDAANLRRAGAANLRKYKSPAPDSPAMAKLKAKIAEAMGPMPLRGSYKGRRTRPRFVVLAFDSNCGQDDDEEFDHYHSFHG